MNHNENFYFPHQFGDYQSPEEAYKQHRDLNDNDDRTLEWYRNAANKTNKECINCGRPIWRMCADLEMCFTCITGESDASDDYELEPAL